MFSKVQFDMEFLSIKHELVNMSKFRFYVLYVYN